MVVYVAWNNAQQQRAENLRLYSMLAQLLGGRGVQQQQAGLQGINTPIGLNAQNQSMSLNQFGMLAQILGGVPLNQTQRSQLRGRQSDGLCARQFRIQFPGQRHR